VAAPASAAAASLANGRRFTAVDATPAPDRDGDRRRLAGDLRWRAARRHAGRRRPAVHRIADTTFFGEAAPPIDAATWRLDVTDGGAVKATYDLAAVRALGEVDQTAILDCTSGWALETTWRGVRLATVLRAAGTRPDPQAIEIRSATGWSSSLDPSELDSALIATGVGGGPLPLVNGAPCRLVAPNRRGLDWVKWVTEIRVT
jgi:DMSO/TMAO reductase YedYZ molybdopterin-dependent catalytic subunit